MVYKTSCNFNIYYSTCTYALGAEGEGTEQRETFLLKECIQRLKKQATYKTLVCTELYSDQRKSYSNAQALISSGRNRNAFSAPHTLQRMQEIFTSPITSILTLEQIFFRVTITQNSFIADRGSFRSQASFEIELTESCLCKILDKNCF